MIDDTTKREILDAFETVLRGYEERSKDRHDETHTAIKNLATDHARMRSDISELRTRVEALEGSRAAHDARLSGQEAALRDGIAEAKRAASDVAAHVEGTLDGIAARHDALATTITRVDETATAIRSDVDAIKSGVEEAVLGVLSKHVASIEAAADKLTKTPQVRTAASIGGAFAGSATIAALFEALHMLHVLP